MIGEMLSRKEPISKHQIINLDFGNFEKPYKLRHAAMAAIGAIAVRAKAAADAQKRPREEEECPDFTRSTKFFLGFYIRQRPNPGALIITNTILGVPYYNYSIMGPKTPF